MRSTPASPSSDVRRLSMNGVALLAGGANVVMQLCAYPVGRGVYEHRGGPGALERHPVRRTRTTLSYIVLALFGTDDERAWLRRDVDEHHRRVHSSPASPVHYDAFDPTLQRWVAACLYRGAADVVRALYGELEGAVWDSLYLECARFATTLQVPASLWPRDRDAFDQYWQRQLTTLSTDAETRAYLRDLIRLRFLPFPLSPLVGPLYRFVTVGFLPAAFREELGLHWTARSERRFRRLIHVLARVMALLPAALREFPWNLLLLDARRRRRRGHHVVPPPTSE